MTLATDNVNESTDCNAILLKGNAVAHTAIVAEAPKNAFFRFVINIHLSTVFAIQSIIPFTSYEGNDFFLTGPTKCTTNL